jgi:hypothetical protein
MISIGVFVNGKTFIISLHPRSKVVHGRYG